MQGITQLLKLTSKVTLRQLANFKKVKFILDLQMKDWELITTCDITSDVWDIWKELLSSVMHKKVSMDY